MLSAQDALAKLKAGNDRYVTGDRLTETNLNAAGRGQLLAGQSPFAVIVGCADSRVPVELIFDQGLGDLFVIRVAGNVAAASTIGSVEYAVAELGTRLVVVLGHTSCGAVGAALADLREPIADLSPSLRSLVGRIQPAIKPLLADGKVMGDAVRANVRFSAEQFRSSSDVIDGLCKTDGLMIVGAEYSLESGKVAFL